MIDTLIERLIDREGGYVDHLLDDGGPTNMGITLRTLGRWRQEEVTRTDVKALTKQEAKAIYKALYWEHPGLGKLGLSPVVTEMVFDCAVLAGPGRAKRLLQRAAGVKVDGLIGPVTQRCIRRLDGPHLAALFMGERIMYLGERITKDPDNAVFAAGWMKRLREFVVQIPLA